LGDDKVGLETHFTSEWGKNFTGLAAVSRERFAFKEDLKEDLGIEGPDGGVERCSWNGGIDDILYKSMCEHFDTAIISTSKTYSSSDGVGRKKGDGFLWAKAGISESSEDSRNAVYKISYFSECQNICNILHNTYQWVQEQ